MKFRLPVLILLVALTLTACNFSLAADVTPPPGYIPPTPPPTLGPLFPAAAPDIARGAEIYLEKCEPCHGLSGLGDGAQGVQLPVTVAALGLPDVARAAVPAAWYKTVTQGNLDKFMPPFTSLSDQDRWNVVAYSLSLSMGDEQIARGAEIFARTCAGCHGPAGDALPEASFRNQALMAGLSQADLYAMTAGGNPPAMPAFAGTLNDADLWAVTAYLRSLTFATPVVVAETPAATATPQTSATDASGTAVAPEGGTPAPSVVEGPTATAEGPARMTVTGSLINGSGGPLPENQIVTLRGFSHGADGSVTEIYSVSQTAAADGSYTFSDLPVDGNPIYLVEAQYAGLGFSSEPAFVETGTTRAELSVTIYETTTDTSGLSVDRWHLFLNFDQPGVIQVVEVMIISNPDIKVVIPSVEGGPVLNISLPEGAANLQFEDETALGTRFIQTANGFYDNQPIGPGSGAYQLLFAFDLPYDRSLDFAQPYDLPVGSAVVLVPQGVSVQSDQLTDGGLRDFQGQSYQMYSSATLPAGGTFEMTVKGAVDTSAPVVNPDSRDGLLIGAGALGVALILAGGYLFWRDRRRADEQDEDSEDSEEDEGDEEDDNDYEDSEDLMDAVIALDDLHKAGKLSDEAYHARREELTARIKEALERKD